MVKDYLSATLLQLHRFEEAKAKSEEMIVKYPTSPKGYLRLGKILMLSNCYAEAILNYKIGIERTKSSKDLNEVNLLTEMLRSAEEMSIKKRKIVVAANLPVELISLIMTFLPKDKYFECMTVSRIWSTIILNSKHIWNPLALNGKQFNLTQLKDVLERFCGIHLRKCRFESCKERQTEEIFVHLAGSLSTAIKSLEFVGCTLAEKKLNFSKLKLLWDVCLVSLSLENCNFSAGLIETFLSLSNLKRISFKGSFVFPNIIPFNSIQDLIFESLDIPRNFFTNFKSIHKIEFIKVHILGPQLFDIGSKTLSHLTLKDVEYTSNGVLFSDWLVTLLREGCLTHYYSSTIFDNEIQSISLFGSSLLSLTLPGERLTCIEVEEILEECRSLESLNIPRLADRKAIASIHKLGKNLFEIDLSQSNIDDSLLYPFKDLACLVKIHLNSTRISSSGILKLVKDSGRRWQHLSVEFCENLSFESIQKLQLLVPRVEFRK